VSCPSGLERLQSRPTAAQKSADGIVGRTIGRRPERSPQGVEGEDE
jgi:hypothetical protein